jgi:hypothetical protein
MGSGKTTMVNLLLFVLFYFFISQTAVADPSQIALSQAAAEAGCPAISPDIKKISESGEVLKQTVYQVECDSLRNTYVIVVCEGNYDCKAR